MRILYIILILSIPSLLLFSSCKKNPLEDPGNTLIIPGSGPDTSKVPPPIVYKRTVNIGTGSGSLVFDGATFAVQCNDLIKIKGGSYSSITIKNVISADGCPITFKNDGLVEVAGDYNAMSLSNLKNVVISGDGTAGLSKGFLFRDNIYRAVVITGTLDKFTFQNAAFKNVKDLDISFKYNAVYDGTESSYSKNLKFLNISCDNTNQFMTTGGYIENGVVYGLVKDIEIANVDFQNAPDVGTVVFMGNAEDYNIHNNRINNINTANNNHNGIFQIAGNGRFHDNYISNHQGNSIRAWGHTVGSTPKDILIYNNIVINSRKYSGFEVQAYADRIVSGKTTYVNAIVFNNTCGNLNLSNDWQAAVVDVYSLQGGKCDVYNNLGYNFKPNQKLIALQWAELIPNTSYNLYDENFSDTGMSDQSSFNLTAASPAKQKGRPTPFVITDFYGKPRNASAPSIGAIE
ncbi:hypothetical protein TH53_01355 [Pedobacter lusitanus]|uniref:Right handed beta helix domain-containing protein n=1 Tax=Pedobacter lusitanus TaxID=1503925 RepID=A0A0D0G1V7_9SPHI|nr:hypothetical protein [Pedobacter lusitanus]KIO78769.1 hypothetical protein TH53_01355 [Pedobacter lusitanus]